MKARSFFCFLLNACIRVKFGSNSRFSSSGILHFVSKKKPLFGFICFVLRHLKKILFERSALVVPAYFSAYHSAYQKRSITCISFPYFTIIRERKTPVFLENTGVLVAPQVGLEPTTLRLTAECLYVKKPLLYRCSQRVLRLPAYRSAYETAFF